LILLVLTLISGILSSSEIAVSSANRNRVKLLADMGDKKAARLLRMMDEPSSFFATTQLYITFIAFYVGVFAADVFTEPLVAVTGMPEMLAFVSITAVLTYFTLILGELVPKRLAMQYAIPFALRAIYFLRVLMIIALPFVKLLSVSAKFILRLMGIRGDKPEEDVTKEEIRLMVESGSEHGHISEAEQGMIENILAFNTMTVAEICTHRLDLVALPIDADFNTVLELMNEEQYSRVPVYEEDIDHIRGILHLKDMIRYMANRDAHPDFDLRELLREPYFIPDSKKAGELFQEMRREQVYIAVVLDEYGGTQGIVTVEDLVVEIVGSIRDEYDSDEPEIIPLGDGVFEIQGGAYLQTVQAFFGVELPVEEFDTLSGFLVGELGYIPAEDEKPEVSYGELRFQVADVQEKRVVKAIVTRVAEEEIVEASS